MHQEKSTFFGVMWKPQIPPSGPLNHCRRTGWLAFYTSRKSVVPLPE